MSETLVSKVIDCYDDLLDQIRSARLVIDLLDDYLSEKPDYRNPTTCYELSVRYEQNYAMLQMLKASMDSTIEAHDGAIRKFCQQEMVKAVAKNKTTD